jgi:hypothetical protein
MTHLAAATSIAISTHVRKTSSFTSRGIGGIAGTYTGHAGLYALAGKAMFLRGGAFREDVEDILANDNHAVVLVRHRFTRDGQLKDYRTPVIEDFPAHAGELFPELLKGFLQKVSTYGLQVVRADRATGSAVPSSDSLRV